MTRNTYIETETSNTHKYISWVWATRNEQAARAIQDRIVHGFQIDDFFPPAADLPEGLTDAELQTKYGGVGGEDYRRIIQDIERRIATCSGYN